MPNFQQILDNLVETGGGFGNRKYLHSFGGDCRLSDNEYHLLKERIQHKSSPEHGIGVEDAPLSDNDDIRFYTFQNRVILRLNDRYGTIRRISDLPGVDKVLRPGDDHKLRQPQRRLYRKFREFLDQHTINYTGSFKCVRRVLPSSQDQNVPVIYADRPFPLYIWENDMNFRVTRVTDLGLGRSTARRLYHASDGSSGYRIRRLFSEVVIYLGADPEPKNAPKMLDLPEELRDFIHRTALHEKIPCCFRSSRWYAFLQHHKCLGPTVVKRCKRHTEKLCLEWNLHVIYEDDSGVESTLIMDGTLYENGSTYAELLYWNGRNRPRVKKAYLSPIAYGDWVGMRKMLARHGNEWPSLEHKFGLDRKYLINYVLACRLTMRNASNACFSTMEPGRVNDLRGLPTIRELRNVFTTFDGPGETWDIVKRVVLEDTGPTYHRLLPGSKSNTESNYCLDKPIAGYATERYLQHAAVAEIAADENDSRGSRLAQIQQDSMMSRAGINGKGEMRKSEMAGGARIKV